MISEPEIRELSRELSKLTAFIAEYGDLSEFDKEDWAYSCNVSDALSWVLGEIESKHFRSDAHLNLEALRQVALAIEAKTGKQLENYDPPVAKGQATRI